MKATGEVMAIARSFEAALQKAMHSLEENRKSLLYPDLMAKSLPELEKLLENIDNTRIYVVAAAIYNDMPLEKIIKNTRKLRGRKYRLRRSLKNALKHLPAFIYFKLRHILHAG